MAQITKKNERQQEKKTEEIALPSFVSAMPAMANNTPLPGFVKPAWQLAPVVMFAHPASTTFYPRIAAAHPGIATGTPVMILPNGEAPLKLDPFKFMLLSAKQFFCTVDGQGNPVQCFSENDREDLKEYIDSLLLVFTEHGIIPATCQWRTTKCQGIHAAYDQQQNMLTNPDKWAAQSPEHQLTMQMPHVYARFTCTIQLQSQTGKKSGLPMQIARGVINPATVADWKLLQEAFVDNPRIAGFLSQCKEAYQQRLRDIASKMIS